MSRTRCGIVAGLIIPIVALGVMADEQRQTSTDRQAWDGVLYGNPTHGDTVSSTPVRGGEAVWLRVPVKRTGRINGVLFEVRRAMNAREANGSPGTYSNGDGGKLRLQIRPIGNDGKPTREVLAQSQINNGFDGPICLDGVWAPKFAHYQVWTLDRPVELQKGQRLALWVQNEDTDPEHANWSATNFMELYAPIPYGEAQRDGPYYGDDLKCVRVRWWGEEQERKGSGGVWELCYEDGVRDGNPYAFSTGQFRKDFGGDRMVRQTFTVLDEERKVDGLWFRLFWESKKTSDLVLQLEDKQQGVLATLKVPRSEITRTDALHGSPPARWCHAQFAEPVTLRKGQTYSLIMSAETGSYTVHPVQTVQMPDRNLAHSRNQWEGAYAQYSVDGGKHWVDGWDRPDRPGRTYRNVVLSLAFTVAHP